MCRIKGRRRLACGVSKFWRPGSCRRAVFCATGSLLVDIPAARKQPILEHLDPYLAANEAEARDICADYAKLSLQGPHAERLVADTMPSISFPSKDLDHLEVAIRGHDVILILVTHAGDERLISFSLCRTWRLLFPILKKRESAGLFRGSVREPRRCSA